MKVQHAITHRQIDFTAGMKLHEAVDLLLRYNDTGEKVYGNYNGQLLYSDSVSEDSAYILMFNKTREESEKELQKEIDEVKRKTEEHKAKIPELSKEWIEKGSKILEGDKLEYWKEIVPIRLGDLYKGMELGQTLDAIEFLQLGGYDEAKRLIHNQGHSHMSYGLIKNMIREFDSRGPYFIDNYLD